MLQSVITNLIMVGNTFVTIYGEEYLFFVQIVHFFAIFLSARHFLYDFSYLYFFRVRLNGNDKLYHRLFYTIERKMANT